MSPLQPTLPFKKPSTHTAQLKRGFSYSQDLLRKAHSVTGKTWAHGGLSHGVFSSTPAATITSIRTVTPSEQVFSPVTSWIPIYTDLSMNLRKSVQRAHTTAPSFAQSLLNISGKFTNEIQANPQQVCVALLPSISMML